MKRLLLILLALLPGLAAALPDLTLYVAPDGNDAWSGGRPHPAASDGPLRTLAAAQARARIALAQRRAAGAGGVNVIIEPGTYRLEKPLAFDPADSGLPGAPMVYEAAEPGTVTISGGLPLTPMAPTGSGGEVDFAAPGVDAAFWAGAPQLYVNGRRAVLAREPNEGADWFAGQAVAAPGEHGEVAGLKGNTLGREAFRGSPQALAFLGHLSTADRQRAFLSVMQSWTSNLHRLAFPAPAGAVRVSPPARQPFLFFGSSQRYFVENVEAALDQPGEWIGAATTVRYLVRNDDSKPLNVVLPRLEQLVIVRGAGPRGPYVEHLELRGLGFEHSLSLVPAAGWIDTQAAVQIGAAVQVDFARAFAMRGCWFTAIGGYGVWLRDGVRDNILANSKMYDLGAGGIKIGPVNLPKPSDDNTGANMITSNEIHNTGQLYPGAVGVWVGPSSGNKIVHNTITDTTYSAISVGWQWGYDAPGTSGNVIDGNALMNIGRGDTADVGAIYTLGISPATVITSNFIRNVRGYRNFGAGAFGIYNDEGSSGLRIEDNVVVGTDSGGYHLNYGRDNTVQHNVFAHGDEAEFSVFGTDPARTHLMIRNNLVISEHGQPFEDYARPPDATFSDNNVSSAVAAINLQPCAGGCRRSSVTMTVGPGPQEIHFVGLDAPEALHWAMVAANAGRPQIDGVDNASLAKPVAMDLSATAAEPQAPPLDISLDLDNVPEHGRPAGWQFVPPQSVETMADSSAPGGRCLLLKDSASLPHRAEPYIYVLMNHDHGTSTASFALRIDDKSDFVQEWRDDASPYHTGPRLRISRNGVEVAGQVVAPPQSPGNWMHVSVNAPVDGGEWNLAVTEADGRVYRANHLRPVSADWHGLRWLGFISNADVESNSCLADVRVTNAR